MDNGLENQELKNISLIKQIYRCRPYNSSDNGSIENWHKLLRYYIPKGKSIDNFKNDEIEIIQNKINNYPRKIFDNDQIMSANEFENLIK